MAVIPEETTLQGVAQLMVRANLISKDEAIQCQNLANNDKQSFIQFIVSHHVIPATQVATFLGESFGTAVCDLDCIEIDPQIIKLINENLIRKYKILPVFKRGKQLLVAIEDPSKDVAIKDIQFSTGFQINLVVVESDKLRDKISILLRQSEQASRTQGDGEESELANIEIGYSSELATTADLDVLGGSQAAPIVRFVDKVMQEAMNKRASDIHFEPYEHDFRIRFRIDGVLVEVATPPLAVTPKITARIKILSNLDISERRIPQDGRFNIKNSMGHEVECRVSTCPVTFGEKVVLRLLDPAAINLNINSLGFTDTQVDVFLNSIQRPHGLIMVTGPTGSGKSLTLYNALNVLNKKEVNICTVEDPVEMRISGVNQVNINPKAGLTFATTLRSFLRQDPDVIMVGEIRDLETAEIAVSAAQTGHLVLSTLHTNDAASSIVRLRNMGIPSYNIASSIVLLMAQRLVRRLCTHCKKPVENTTKESLMELGFTAEESEHLTLYRAAGCFNCTNGYNGRVAIYEMITINKELEDLIVTNASSIELEKAALKYGMKTIHRSGLDKVIEGITTIEEVNRVAIE
jgi:type IV pilus assembly protein PilB